MAEHRHFLGQTIVAAATPQATGAIAILRLSGPDAIAIAASVFETDKGQPLSDLPPRYAHMGRVLDKDGAVLDRCLALTFPAPHSYTGENCAEIQCHGGLALQHAVLARCLEAGARLAQPGEFTKRAFLNGKLDLSGAEAVADLINAETPEGIRNAAGQLSGRLAEELASIETALTDCAAHFTAYIDYTEEGVEPPEMTHVLPLLDQSAGRLFTLSRSFSEGRLFTDGIRCAIVGRPNAGKSSLLNAVCGFERSIVTDIAGTTRDTVEETVRMGPVLLRLTDTAGLRESLDPVEQLGVLRSRQAADCAGLVWAVFDGSVPFSKEDEETLALCQTLPTHTVCIINKADLLPSDFVLDSRLPADTVLLSAKTGQGLDTLKQRVETLFSVGSLRPDGSLLTNRRQAEALEKAAGHVTAAAEALRQGFTPDVALIDTEAALYAIGEVSGKTASQEILDRVFSNFCVGK